MLGSTVSKFEIQRMSFRRSANDFIFHSIKHVGCRIKKLYLWGILVHPFIQKKSAADVHIILVEIYGDYSLSERIWYDWFRDFKSNYFDV